MDILWYIFAKYRRGTVFLQVQGLIQGNDIPFLCIIFFKVKGITKLMSTEWKKTRQNRDWIIFVLQKMNFLKGKLCGYWLGGHWRPHKYRFLHITYLSGLFNPYFSKIKLPVHITHKGFKIPWFVLTPSDSNLIYCQFWLDLSQDSKSGPAYDTWKHRNGRIIGSNNGSDA